MKNTPSIGNIMIAYDLKSDQNDNHFCPQTKYGIITSIDITNAEEPYHIEWGDGATSTHPSWEINIIQTHTELVLNNNCVTV